MLAYFLAFLGGIALFMYGMQLMGDGLQKAAGAKLQKILEAMTGVLAMGILLGAVVTAVLQASGATTVMTVGLVNAGLLTLKQGFGIIMGANIGTTMTAQLIAFKLSDYITILIFIGFLMQLLARKSRTKYLGQVMLGFGILMLGMDMMGKAVMPLRNYSGFVHFIEVFSSNPLLGIGIGMIMTVLIQSSSATIGILIAMAGQGLIPLEGAIPVLLGDNIGTCITAVLASLRANLTAKRVAAAHVMFNVIGSIIFVILMPFFIKFVLLVSPDGDIARQIANAHSAFNILNTLLFMPFVNPFIKLVEKIVPGKAEIISMRPVYLDKNMLNTPSIAISLAVKEVVRMGELARKDVRLGMEAIQSFDADKVSISVDGKPIAQEAKAYYMFYKPRGVVTTMSDPQNRRSIADFVQNLPERVFPVGRLDFNTEGLLLLTNDGALAQALMHPSHEVNKTYFVKVPGIVPQEKLDQLRLGVKLEDGPTAPAIVNLRDYDHERGFTLFDITIHEGRNRQIRRMCDAIGFPVRDLKRIKLGPLQLQNLGRGKFRSLSEQELSQLRKAAKL